MKKSALILFMLICFSNFSNAQSQNSYTSMWEQVYQFELESLPKSALKIVEKIYSSAKKENNTIQITKAIIYKSKFALLLEENAQLKIISELKQEIKLAQSPSKNILENILAKWYWQYYEQNRYRFYQRTKTAKKIDAVDFRTWDLQTLYTEVHTHYQNSLKNATLLQNTALRPFSELLQNQKDSQKYRPTLFDFLAHNALEFYAQTELNITKPAYKFELNNASFFNVAKDFIKQQITTKDTLSLQFNSLLIYQNLIKFHLKNKNTIALASIDLERLNFIKKHSTVANKKLLFEETLHLAYHTYKDSEASAMYGFALANLYFNQAKNYNPKHKKTADQFKNKEALQLCKAIIQKFPNTKSAQFSKQLIAVIENPSLQITSEEILPINKKSKLLIRYKNLDKLYFTAFRITKKQRQKFHKIYNDSTKIAFINKLKVAKKWNNPLKTEGDFQQHSTEVIVPEFTNGMYLIVASKTNSLDKDKLYATAFTQSSNLVLIEKSVGTKMIYQVVDRNTGKPIEGAKITLRNYKETRYRYEKAYHKTFTSNVNGEFIVNANNYYRNLEATVQYKGDNAIFNGFYIYQRREPRNYKRTQEITFLFTDRSIYRPGQTVFFKGIVLDKKQNKSNVVANQNVTVKLTDANGQEVKTTAFTTNSFGSFAGEFILPSNGLTGNFYLSANNHNNYYGNVSISVEEYKRPKFEANFKPITETFKINDSVLVIGEAKAFAGSVISDAKVIYSVRRKVNYPRWWYWYRPQFTSEAQEIKHGETSTDANGNFKITFKALADTSTNKKDLPVFTYEITADITDINGETRSTTTNIKVGYHTTLAEITITERLDKNNKENTFEILTKNLNGEKVNSKGSVKIYKLEAPKYVLRSRPWKAPDYQVISKDNYQEYFKHDAYQDEDNSINWKKGKKVYDNTFDTSKKTKYDLKKTKKWTSGKYLIIVATKDNNGLEVKDQQRFEVFAENDKTVADNQLFTISTNKESYKPAENVELRLGSASKNMYITLVVEKNNQLVHSEIIHLQNEIKTIRIPVKNNDLGGFSVHYQYVNYNSFGSGNSRISVPYPTTDLQIEASTFRDKLQPNQEETWKFNIKGAKGEKVTSELLAAMYDASLDMFKPHQWRFNPINYSYYYPTISSNAQHSIQNTSFNIQNIPYRSFYAQNQKFDTFNWFGFHMYNRWQNNQYLRTLKMIRKDYDYIITGQIQDTQGPLPGVNIIIKGTNFGTITDFDGNYSIKVKKGETLQFSFIGYTTVEKKIENSNSIHLTLESGNDELEEVVVTALSGKVAGLKIRGKSSIAKKEMLRSAPAPQVMAMTESEEIVEMDAVEEGNTNNTDPSDKKKAIAKPDFSEVKIRKNLQETAFFFPQLQTDSKGNVSFSFTTPEALTRWNVNLLAHTKEGCSAQKSLQTVTQKELMVLPNAPRFLRESDTLVFASKISNLTSKTLTGIAALQLTDAVTGKNIDTSLQNTKSNQTFTVDAKGNTNINWKLIIPSGIQAVQYKVIAKAGTFSDGEQNALPVLSNRMLVTETLPMWVRSNQTKIFTLDKLKNNTSKTLVNHRLTLEMTSNPAWYAVQALPYLMEYPYECAEQTFSRFYANSLASHIANSNPRIQEVFNQWKNSDALLSNLEKNQALKSLIIQETPWLRDAQSETEQKKRIGLLFDLNHMSNNLQSALRKLEQMQRNDGAWGWFQGSRYPNRYITQHIATGFGHLNKLQVSVNDKASKMINNAVSFLDKELINDYNKLIKQAKKIRKKAKTKAKGLAAEKAYLAQDHTSYFQLQFLYMRSFYNEKHISKSLQKAMDYYIAQSQTYWLKRNLYSKGMIALIHYRNNNISFANSILKSLKENSITSEELGMYWKENTPSWYWYQAPIETQALLIEAFSEISSETKTIDNLKVWLLKNKQTNRWKTTKATTEAVYALLLQGSEWLAIDEQVEVQIGKQKITPSKLQNVQLEAGTGYYKTSWNASEISPEMASVTISKKDKGIAWGGLYWQYFEDLDKITTAETPLQLKKKLFLKSNAATGKELSEITAKTKLKLGDLITVRIELRCDRQMEFIHMKDTRAAGLEPVNVLSQYKWQDGLGYYESTKDASTNFFISHLPKGVFVFEYDLRVNNTGNFSNGITTIQSMYAPEFSSHSEGIRISVK